MIGPVPAVTQCHVNLCHVTLRHVILCHVEPAGTGPIAGSRDGRQLVILSPMAEHYCWMVHSKALETLVGRTNVRQRSKKSNAHYYRIISR